MSGRSVRHLTQTYEEILEVNPFDLGALEALADIYRQHGAETELQAVMERIALLTGQDLSELPQTFYLESSLSLDGATIDEALVDDIPAASLVMTSAAAPAPSAGAQAPSPDASQAPRDRRKANRVSYEAEIRIDGNVARVLDLSSSGAQVICTSRIRPTQRVRVVLDDLSGGSIQLTAIVAWSHLELVKGEATYRFGLQFLDIDPAFNEFLRAVEGGTQ